MGVPLQSADIDNFNWLLANFVRNTDGVRDAVAVSSDGLLIATSAGLDRTGADHLSAIVSSMASAREGAPPCSGPASAPIAPVSAEPMSEPVDVITREVNVEELKPWSMVRIKYCSSALAVRGAGRSPVSICRYAAA